MSGARAHLTSSLRSSELRFAPPGARLAAAPGPRPRSRKWDASVWPAELVASYPNGRGPGAAGGEHG
jgi:hypothetical protein